MKGKTTERIKVTHLFTDEEQELVDEIIELKRERNAVILAHNYQMPQVQLIGDFLGDSYDLSKKAATSEAEMIVVVRPWKLPSHTTISARPSGTPFTS